MNTVPVPVPPDGKTPRDLAKLIAMEAALIAEARALVKEVKQSRGAPNGKG